MPTGSTMNAPRQAGAGLVEVAIALLLLSIGALGLANMQIGAKRLGFEALQRTEAAALAGDLFERMRANRQGLQRYRSAGIGEGSGRRLAVPGRNCDTQSCEPAERGDWDLWQWEAALNGTVGGGTRFLEPSASESATAARVRVRSTYRSSTSIPAASGWPR